VGESGIHDANTNESDVANGGSSTSNVLDGVHGLGSERSGLGAGQDLEDSLWRREDVVCG
jgi:hypothetical protein